MTSKAKNNRYDKATVKQAASGRWKEILTSVGGYPADSLDDRHHGCPICGQGKDCFRLIDQDAGAVLCNKCFSEKNGDGFAALMKMTGKSFPEILADVAEFLGVKPSRNGRAKSKRSVKKPRVFATTQGIVRWFLDGLAKSHGGPARLVKTWQYDTFHVLRFDVPTPAGEKQRKEFRPVHQVPLGLEGGKGWQAGYPPGPRPLYRREELEAAPPKLVTIHGGEKAADAAVDLGLVATTNAGGEQAVAKTDWKPLSRFATVAIVIDNDPAGEKFGLAVAVILKTLKPDLIVKIIKLPGPPKGDVVEWIAAGGIAADFVALVEATEPVTGEQIAEWSKAGQKKRSNPDREITIGTDEPRVIDEAIEAIATRDNVYQRGGSLVQIIQGVKPPRGIARSEDAPRITPMRYPRIREHLADAATWLRPAAGEDEAEEIHPPDWVVKAIDARGQWSGIRRLEAVVESPILRADGSVLQAPGYDLETGIYFRPQCSFPAIPARPTRDDAIRARDALLEVWEDFPFAADAHRAACLAGVLTPLARYGFAGPAPLELVDANTAGSGKSLLIDTTAIITTGRPMARMSLPRDDDEMRKRITSIAIAGEPETLIDNVGNAFGSPSLDAALTATSWSDRFLGRTEMASNIPLYTCWYATGNNVALVGDTTRRVIHVRLETSEENPEERSGFRHPDLLGWVRQERPRLTAAAVTILAAYCTAGRPDMKLKPWGSFEGWSDLVRSAVAWIGMADPGASRTDLASTADREAVALRQLLNSWGELDPGGHGMTVGDALRELADRPDLYDGLRAALWELAPPRDGRTFNARSIGNKMAHLRRRVVGGKYLDRRDTNRGGMWLVRGTSDTDDTGDTSTTLRGCADARTRENPEPTVGGVTGVSGVTDCPHSDVDETPTGDGYVNRECRACGADLLCRKMEANP